MAFFLWGRASGYTNTYSPYVFAWMWGFFSLFYFLNLEKERDGGKASFKRVGLLSSSQFCILAWDWLTCWRQWFRMKWTHAFSFLVMVRILTLHFIKLTSGLLDSFFYLLHQIKCFGITSRMPSNSFKLKQCRKGKSGLKEGRARKE